MGGTSAIGTLNSTYNEKKYAKILLHYRQLFVKGNVFIGEWGIFGAEVFLCYSRFFVKGDFVIGGVECICACLYIYRSAKCGVVVFKASMFDWWGGYICHRYMCMSIYV